MGQILGMAGRRRLVTGYFYMRKGKGKESERGRGRRGIEMKREKKRRGSLMCG